MSFFKVLREFANISRRDPDHYRWLVQNQPHKDMSHVLVEAQYWMLEGCPTFTIDGKTAATMAATTCHPEILIDVVAPFQCFGVLVDSSVFGGLLDGFLFVANRKKENGEQWWMHVLSDDGVSYRAFQCRQSELLRKFTGGWEDLALQRAVELMRSVLLGLLLHLDNSGSGSSVSSCRHHKADDRRGLSGYSEYKFTGPIGVDVRKEVREFALTGGGCLQTQTLVRGHWKMQPCGPGRTERKHIHVMPYWKGPIDAPVALRCPQ